MSHIKLDHINLIFNVKKGNRIKDILISGSKRFGSFDSSGHVHALNDISLEINEGDRLAIVGHNGAGKSTFLRLISQIYAPTSGKLEIKGKISGLYEFATGFNMEQNGWDNIYLRGLMQGQTPKEIIDKMPEIAEFSELGSFLNMPVKYYSSGMFLRLSFAVSTAIEPDILLLDEALAAGDASFIEKAKKRMDDMMKISKILVLVTHSMQAAIDMCNRCIWLERGRVIMDGAPKEVTEKYYTTLLEKNNEN